jgi:hypothetical protein
VPALPIRVINDSAGSPETDLSGTDLVFPQFPEVFPVNNAVLRIVTKIGVDLPDFLVHLARRHASAGEQIENRI